ncbi:MAG: U32 family peptidase [Clostridia bacterium]|nr:U32 family peptidase [Clostridia bacterium]
MVKKPEILAPAGDFSRLIYAIEYGADAVYVGGEEFSLRAAAGNFTRAELRRAVEYVHGKQKKIYVACNIVPRNEDLDKLPEYAAFLQDAGVDAVIISDLGSFTIFRRHAPKVDIHISTQANVSNYETCMAWYHLGAKRVVLARELSLDEILEIRRRVPEEMELETFVHGAMCMAYSGRCLLSQFLTGRDSNRGYCAQPCRWKYTLMEEKRPGQYFPVVEGEKNTLFMNSKDLSMIEHLPELCEAGIASFKIEGRIKTEYYVAVITQAYRRALDDCFSDVYLYTKNLPTYVEQVDMVSHRPYYTGFYFPDSEDCGQSYHEPSYIRNFELVGMITGYDALSRRLFVTEKNKICAGDELYIVEAGQPLRKFYAEKMYDETGAPILFAPHPEMKLTIEYDKYVTSHSFLVKKNKLL